MRFLNRFRSVIASLPLVVVANLHLGLSAWAVTDTTPPILQCPTGTTRFAEGGVCEVRVNFNVTATDDIGTPTVVCTPPSGSLFPLGVTVVHCVATDTAGNTSTCEFPVLVRPLLVNPVPCEELIVVPADPGQWGAIVNFAVADVVEPCFTAEMYAEPASGSFFPIGTTTVVKKIRLPWGDEGVCYLDVVVTPPDNIVWPRALEVPLADNLGVLEGTVEQALTEFDESRWFKVKVQPGSRLIATLTGLPANYDLVLFKDIAKAYQELTSPEDLPLIDAEFADDAFSPAQFSPAQFSPAQFSPAAFSPAAFSPAQFSPAQFSPAQFSPAQFSPAQFSPDAYAPAQFSPAQFSPAQFSPAQFSPAQFSPAQFSPAQFSEEAYASAQLRSVIAVSAFDGTAGEGVIGNTWNEDTYFYLRVRGRQGVFDPTQTFRLDVYLFPGVCEDITPVPVDAGGAALPPSTTRAPAGGYQTLILTDYDRLVGPGPSAERTALAAKLAELAARPEVLGVVVDVGTDPWVRFFNAQADVAFECPYAKNLVAEAIRAIIDRSRPGNDLQHILLIGNDGILPFFRHPDEALLGPEEDYLPPVLEFTPSQASLRHNYFLTQDRYGAECIVPRKNTELPIPDLAVGRLVETPAEIAGMIDAYLANPGGVLPNPTSVLVTGYDFLEDAANAVADELQIGTGVSPDRLIAPHDLAPGDPDSWTAADLRSALLTQRHDILFLAGHFSAVGTLAADYTTRMLAAEILASPVNLTNVLLYSPGCHSGYNIVDPHAVPGITLEPDWAQVSARKRATLLAGTGYQYGDTDFIEYSERLYLEFTRQLRTGTGPISIGKALVEAKKQYLVAVPHLKGIHEKALLQATLFGLPMLRFDLPGPRLPAPAPASIVTATEGYSSVPPTAGEVLGLQFADVTVEATLTQHHTSLNNAERDPANPGDPVEVQATWFSGADGIVANPAEPVLPLEIRNVDVPGLALRGIGFRGGEYNELHDVIPLTSAATTEIRGVHPAFPGDVFFPTTFWRANYFAGLCELEDGGTRLMVMPGQIRTPLGGTTSEFRTFPKSHFRLFYSGNVTTYVDPATGISSTPALSGPPSISNVRAWSDNGQVHFRMQVVGNPAAGIQEVWVTYTGSEGPFTARWSSLDLTQDPVDSRVWEGVLPLQGVDPRSLRFVVQAVNGVGLVAFAANLGAYYVPDETEVPPVPAVNAVLELLNPPAEAPYGSRIQLAARLTGEGVPLANRVVAFRVGGLNVRGLTDPNGVLTNLVNLLLAPGLNTVHAVFAGGRDYGSATVDSTLLVRRNTTRLILDPAAATVAPGAESTMTAVLTGAAGDAIPEQTIVFVVTGQGQTHIATAITDFNGRAPLGAVPLPAGTYTVQASFGQTVDLPAPFVSVGSGHQLYEASTATASLTLDPLVPLAEDDVVVGRLALAPKIAIAELLANDIDPMGGTLTLVDVDGQTVRGVPITQSGGWLLLSQIPATATSDAFDYTIANASGRMSAARVLVRLVTDDSPSSNLLSITVEGDRVRIRFAGIPGRSYRIQSSPPTTPLAWTTVGSATVGLDGIAEFLAPNLGGGALFRTAYP